MFGVFCIVGRSKYISRWNDKLIDGYLKCVYEIQVHYLLGLLFLGDPTIDEEAAGLLEWSAGRSGLFALERDDHSMESC